MAQWEDRFFTDASRLGRLYHSCMQQAVREYRLTANEITVLLFLDRYAPAQDTATDIAAMHGFSKALVARSVDSLRRRGYLACERDAHDRRIVHLSLCGEGAAVAGALAQNCSRVLQRLHSGIAPEELEAVRRVIKKIQQNMDELLENMESQVKTVHDRDE